MVTASLCHDSSLACLWAKKFDFEVQLFFQFLLIDNFKVMMMEVNNLRLVERLDYALSVQLVERLEEGEKINSKEKVRLKEENLSG